MSLPQEQMHSCNRMVLQWLSHSRYIVLVLALTLCVYESLRLALDMPNNHHRSLGFGPQQIDEWVVKVSNRTERINETETAEASSHNIPPVIPSNRRDRFPSVEERVKIYMSDWYVPPCVDNEQGYSHYAVHAATVQVWNAYRSPVKVSRNRAEIGSVWAAYPDVMRREVQGKHARNYCVDLVDRMIPAMERIGWNRTASALPVLVQFGDRRTSKKHQYLNVPHFKKFRAAYSPHELDHITSLRTCHDRPRPIRNKELEAMIWKLNSDRHYSMLQQVTDGDIPWSSKRNQAIYRGKNTGDYNNFPDALSNCHAMDRCRLVYELANSTLIDAKLTSLVNATLNGVPMLGEAMSITEQLAYKAIIMVEGIDVATGLKWALLSNSVVLMKPPTKTTFAMEERLEPWVHYVPLQADLSDATDRMRWILHHEDHARAIARRATLWMEDLLFHPDADADNQRIEEEMLRRYQRHWKEHRLHHATLWDV